MFRGRFEHTLDDKGRLALPAPFRRALAEAGEDMLVVTPHLTAPCLVASPVSEWRRFEDKLDAFPQFHPQAADVKRLYVGNARDCPIDKQGRLLLPQQHREDVGLVRDVLWVGTLKNIEIWAKERWEAEMEPRHERVGPELVAALAEMGL